MLTIPTSYIYLLLEEDVEVYRLDLFRTPLSPPKCYERLSGGGILIDDHGAGVGIDVLDVFDCQNPSHNRNQHQYCMSQAPTVELLTGAGVLVVKLSPFFSPSFSSDGIVDSQSTSPPSERCCTTTLLPKTSAC